MIFERRGGQGETSPYKQIFQIPAPGGFGKIGACEGTQAVLFLAYVFALKTIMKYD